MPPPSLPPSHSLPLPPSLASFLPLPSFPLPSSLPLLSLPPSPSYSPLFVFLGCLQSYLYNGGPLSVEDAHNYICQLFDALDYLHSKINLVHSDIKRKRERGMGEGERERERGREGRERERGEGERGRRKIMLTGNFSLAGNLLIDENVQRLKVAGNTHACVCVAYSFLSSLPYNLISHLCASFSPSSSLSSSRLWLFTGAGGWSSRLLHERRCQSWHRSLQSTRGTVLYMQQLEMLLHYSFP